MLIDLVYVAPKSMSIDMRAILQGDSVQKDTEALGVLWIRIHRAVGLSKQDKRGSKHGGSDPYITIAFSKYGKPMYCTRVITDDLNPIWEETAAVLVGPELIKANENLSVELWDSDRHTADDIVGKVEISMQKMIQHPGKMYPQTSKLAGMDADSEMPGELHWEVGYFTKPKFRKEMRTDGKNKSLPDELKDKPELQDEKGVINSEEDDAVMHTPPDPLWPSGICSVVCHQIVNLELENVKGSADPRGREYEPAKPYGEGKEETGGDLPNSYCTILFNDELVYRTRAKAVSSQPIFNAGTERFVRDWRSAIITVTVRDQRHREHDPILGVVPLKLSGQYLALKFVDPANIIRYPRNIIPGYTLVSARWRYRLRSHTHFSPVPQHRNPSATSNAWLGCWYIRIPISAHSGFGLQPSSQDQTANWW
jgi:Ca2+-dependent lipid-binding protein